MLEGIAGEVEEFVAGAAGLDFATEGRKVRAKRLPLYLVDAVRALDRNKVLQQALGAEFVSAYVKIESNEWGDYSRHLTDWERTHTLDT